MRVQSLNNLLTMGIETWSARYDFPVAKRPATYQVCTLSLAKGKVVGYLVAEMKDGFPLIQQQRLLDAMLLSSRLCRHDESLLSIREIVSTGVRIVYVMGVNAAQSLLASVDDIEMLRGRVHHLSTDEKVTQVPVVVTHAPAELLAKPHLKVQAWQDMGLLNKLLRKLPG